MNKMLFPLFGLVGGLIFGLLVAWGSVSLLVAGIGAAVLVVGIIFPSNYRPMFGLAVLGYLLGFVAAGGISLL